MIAPAAPLTTANLRVDGGKAIRLALDGAGIRSLEYDEPSKAFHVIAGAGANSGNGDFRILEWKGEGQSELRELARFPGQLKPEGIDSRHARRQVSAAGGLRHRPLRNAGLEDAAGSTADYDFGTCLAPSVVGRVSWLCF